MQRKRKPTFQSSFIQYWYSQSWNLERWEQELIMLKGIGIEEIILASIADTKSKYAVYFSKTTGFTHGEIDMVETALTAAEKAGMKVRIGLGFNDEWWKKFNNRSWLNKEALINKAIINELALKFGEYKAFIGWYIPHEFSQLNTLTKRQQLNLNNFFKSMTSEIKSKLPKSIMIAPYYHGKLCWLTPLRYWTVILENVLKDSGIDIVALQDSIGSNFSRLRQLPSIFDYTKKTLETLGIDFYVDVETFTSTSSGFVSAPQSRIEEQLSIANEYTQGIVAFSIDHYQNKNEQSQVEFYKDYYRYYSNS